MEKRELGRVSVWKPIQSFYFVSSVRFLINRKSSRDRKQILRDLDFVVGGKSGMWS